MNRFFPEDFLKAKLISRPNRFVVNIELEGGGTGASLPNPGKLGELFIPGAILYVQKMRPEVKYPYRVIAVESFNGEVIMLDTHTNNKIAEFLIDSSQVPSLRDYHVKRREVTVGHSRFDLLLENDVGDLLYCEVKSCTLFGGSLAMFPDAVTSRGKRHVEELAQMSQSGIKTAVVFVIQSINIEAFLPDYHTDPEFSETLYQSRKDITIIPLLAGWNENLELITKEIEVPILWDLYEREGRSDRGAYIILFHMKHKTKINMEEYGLYTFEPGFYTYISQENDNLKKNIEKFKRKRKNCTCQRDYLRNHADIDMVWAIRSLIDNSCSISQSICDLSDDQIENFDSTFCECSSHLYFFKDNPRLTRDFQEMLLDYRMRRLINVKR